MLNIGIIGECMVELFDQGEMCKRSFGGDTLNTAIYLARLASPEIAVHYVTALGDDALSQAMIAQWESEGIYTNTVEQIPDSVPGLYMIQTDDNGERSFLYWRDQAPVRKLFQTKNRDDLTKQLYDFNWIYYTGITLAVLEPAGREHLLDTLRVFRQQGGKVAFDMNYRSRLWQGDDAKQWITDAYTVCDLALPSIDDENALWGNETPQSVIDRLRSFGCGEIVLKRGEETCLVSIQDELLQFPVVKAGKVVDTTAAGDSFNAGYLACRMQGDSVIEAIQTGQMIAKQVISQQGAIVPVCL